MYGMINKALQTMVVDHYGEESWQKIRTLSGISDAVFMSMERYDDEITYALVGATAEVLDASAEFCLDAFGHYWATVTAPQHYGMLMDSTGGGLIEFLENVNGMHDRLTSTFIGYVPPHFELEKNSNDIILKYESKREGLTPFVVGVVKGLAERFDTVLDFGKVEKCAVSSGEMSFIHFRVID